MPAFVQNVASVTSKAPGATSVITIVAGKVPAKGNLVVIRAAACDASGSGSASIASVTDTQGNKYRVSSANAFANVPVMATFAVAVLDTALAVGNTITITWNITATAANAATADEFSGVSSNQDRNSEASPGSWVAAATTGSVLGPIPVIADGFSLVFIVMATNGPSGDTYTEDGSAASGGDTWHSLTRVGTTGGGASSNCTVAGAYKFTTALGDQNSQGWAGTTTSRNWECHLEALRYAKLPYVSPLPPLLAQ